MKPCIVFLALLIVCSAWEPLTYPTAISHDSTVVTPQAVTAQRSPDNRPADNMLKASAQSGSTADAQISHAIGSMARRNGIIWADYAANQTWATCPNWGTQNITLV